MPLGRDPTELFLSVARRVEGLNFIQGSPLIAKLFAVGFISSAALGAVAGRLCDKIGTRRGCLLYCV